MIPQFRPTVWPGGELPLPPVPVRDVRLLDHGWLLFSGEERLVEVPADFYLREMATQAPSSDDEIVAFARDWGGCTDPDYRDRPLGMVAASQTVDLELRYGRRVPYSESGGVGTIKILLGKELGVQGWRDLVHIVEIRHRLEHSRWMAQRFTEWRQGVDRDEHIWLLFTEQLNSALSAFQAHIAVGGTRSVVLPQITAYSVSALQLLNDLANETPLRRCGNERCPVGLFTRQRGRSQYGQHRTAGIKYCSSSCARAQGERERRRRNAKGAQ